MKHDSNGTTDHGWTPALVAQAREIFQVKDEHAQCPCGQIVNRTYDGKCWECHVRLFKAIGRPFCPKLP